MRRFWDQVKIAGLYSCWEWQGSTRGHTLTPTLSNPTERGYGLFWLHGKTVRAHRFAYELIYGFVPADALILHACDNPPCVNPLHLSPSTHAENMRQMAERGRARGRPRLSLKQINQIQALAKCGVTSGDLTGPYQRLVGRLWPTSRK